MIEQYSQGKTLLLIVDEAQNLSHKVLEEIRLLSGIESQKEKPLRIILAGQPELSDKLDSLRLEQLRQRVRLRFHLSTLSKRETADYIQHRLDIAGAEGRKIFDKDSIDLVFRYTGGVPRLTNVLCDTAMLCGFSEGKETIDVGLVNEAVNELQWVEYEQRNENRGRFSASHAQPRSKRSLRLVGNVSPPRLSEQFADTSPVEESNSAEADTPDNVYPARFDVLFKDQHITEFKLPMGRAVVGRTGDNDLQIRSRFISRHHIHINSDTEHSTVEDLNSTNGMFMLGKRVQQCTLADGDTIQLGEHKLVYRDLRSETTLPNDASEEPSMSIPVIEDVSEDEDLSDNDDHQDVAEFDDEYDGAETRVLD